MNKDQSQPSQTGTSNKAPECHIAITGATSGLGWALANQYARPGVMLSLSGRNAERLDSITRVCQSKGADVHSAVINVTDHQAVHDWLSDRDTLASVDLLIANAGMGGDDVVPSAAGESGELARQIVMVNTLGVINTITPLLQRMVDRQAGHIVLVGSIAADVGLPQSPAYCASKAAVKIYGDGLRRLVRQHGVKFTTVLPGFIDTPMSRSLDMNRPWCWSPERAARRIARDVDKGVAVSTFPWQLKLGIGIQKLLPIWMADLIFRFSLKLGWEAKKPENAGGQ